MTVLLKPRTNPIRDDFRSSLQWSHDRTFSGFVFDAADPGRKFVVELLVDGYAVACTRAIDPVATLAATGIGDGRYGFTLSLNEGVVQHASVVEARIANLGTMIGEPINLREFAMPGAGLSGPGAVRWLGGVRFSGWIADGCDPAIDVLVDDERVTDVRPSGWSHIGSGEHAKAVRAIDFHVSERFADGSVRRLAVMNSKGEHLEGSPLPFVAFVNDIGLAFPEPASSGSASLRNGILDRLVPMSIPFADYHRWRDSLPKLVAPLRPLKAAVIVVGRGAIDDTLASLDAESHIDWVAGSLPESGGYCGFDSKAARAFLSGDGAEADFVVFALSGTILESNAMARISEAFENNPDTVAVYGDLDIAGDDGSLWPLAFPAFDYDRMLEQGYCSHVFALRRSVAERALDRDAGNLYRLFNSLLDDDIAVSEKIAHLPGSLATLPSLDLGGASEALAAATRAHLKQRGVRARVTPGRGQILPAVTAAQRPDQGSVTIVIPTRNRRQLLEACIESLRPTLRKRDCEVLVIDNDSSDPDTLEYLSSIDGRSAKVLRIAGDFNYARLNNTAAAVARGEFLCLLNNDVQALDGDWLEEMLGRLSGTDVGAVGALLLWPSGVVQHGGVALGPNFAATHVFNDRMDGDAGYGDLLRVTHQCSAVTAACLLTRRRDYLDLGGMDEFRFPVNFNDVDYCLKLRAAGKRIVFTPHAKLLHLESASRGADTGPDRKARFERELKNLRAKWADVLMADPFYNPALSLDPIPFSALAWPLRSMECRLLRRPLAVDVPPGF